MLRSRSPLSSGGFCPWKWPLVIRRSSSERTVLRLASAPNLLSKDIRELVLELLSKISPRVKMASQLGLGQGPDATSRRPRGWERVVPQTEHPEAGRSQQRQGARRGGVRRL